MRIPEKYQSLLELNLAMLFISTSGALGRFIAMPTPLVIAIRAVIAGIILYGFGKFFLKLDFTIDKKDRKMVYLGGFLMGLHWVTYFYSLQLANVAIALLTLFVYPAMTVVLEPLILKTPFKKKHLLVSGLILVGIYVLAPDITLESETFQGICVGLFSALSFSLRVILIKPQVEKYNQTVLMYHQMLIISILLLPSLYLFEWDAFKIYGPYIGLLGLLVTAMGHTLFVYSLKKFSAASASLMSALQPIYGIIIAVLFLGEYPTYQTIIGGTIIIFAVLIESLTFFSKDD